MSHSYDSTLLQRMGFRDPDRKTPAHDRACIELATYPEKLLATKHRIRVGEVTALLEQPLQKGEGKYASTVGFIDVVIDFWESFVDTNEYWRRQRISSWEPFDGMREGPSQLYSARVRAIVEVKTSIGSIGDVLRQMNLYREYTRSGYSHDLREYIIWSLDSDDAQYTALLAKQGYQLVVGPTLDSLGSR